MLLSHFLVSLTATLASAAVLKHRDDKPAISDALKAISRETEALGQAVSSWKGGLLGGVPIVAKSSSLFYSLKRGSNIAQESKPLTEEETLAVASDTQDLVQKVTKTLDTLVQNKPKFESLWLTSIVRQAMEVEKAAADELIENVIAKVPKNLQDVAKQIKDEDDEDDEDDESDESDESDKDGEDDDKDDDEECFVCVVRDRVGSH
ncbi:hypothetical protein XA68_11271 [Ophiocordyceps unilateralis]|uniref:Cell wall protein n=1 Tax=Ophiocordyceps unilateralis TaxID=268505 RepID=A0A2A9PG98_OPHUN|nr:hypothetical protein XA68_11271 [Ophiocordyceps unilateralis]